MPGSLRGATSEVAVCDDRLVEISQADVLARAGNYAVVQLRGRRFPGVHVQGDTLDVLRQQLKEASAGLHECSESPDAVDALNAAIEEIDGALRFYEEVLVERGIRRPY
jgi:predicted RNase H-like HicB family nuclease